MTRPWRTLAVSLAVAAVATVVFGTGGFGAVDADRGVEVSVVDDGAAYVGVVACEKPRRPNGAATRTNASPDVGSTPVRLWVTNRYEAELAVVEIREAGVSPRNRNAARRPARIPPGEDARFEVTFGGDASRVTVDVEGADLAASVTRTVVPKRACPRHVGGGPGAARNESPAGRAPDRPGDGPATTGGAQSGGSIDGTANSSKSPTALVFEATADSAPSS